MGYGRRGGQEEYTIATMASPIGDSQALGNTQTTVLYGGIQLQINGE